MCDLEVEIYPGNAHLHLRCHNLNRHQPWYNSFYNNFCPIHQVVYRAEIACNEAHSTNLEAQHMGGIPVG